MIAPPVQHRLRELFPLLQAAPDFLWERIVREARPAKLAAGNILFESGSPCDHFPLLLDGGVRVVNTGDNGRELLLYRLEPGDLCVINTVCLLGKTARTASGIAQTNVSLVLLPSALFNSLVQQCEPFRTFVFRLLAERLGELMQLVEAVAFQQLDRRLATLLLARGDTLLTTHQKLADELGSVREIISRLLRRFEAQGLVELGRERIRVRDADGLRLLAAPVIDR